MFYYLFLGYIIFISLVSIFICCYDKLMAIKGKERISENTLISLSILGGALTMYITMKIIRHKTKHLKFMIGLPLIIVFQIISILLIIKNI